MKKFIIKSSFYFVPFVVLLLIYRYLIIPNISGDIGMLAQITFGQEYDNYLSQNYLQEVWVMDTLVHKAQKLQINPKPKVITMGDSFSLKEQQKIFRYSNYLSYFSNTNVVNIITPYWASPIQQFICLINSEIIDSTTCDVLILESVDREFVARLVGLNFDKKFKEFTPPKIRKNNNNNNNNNFNLYNFCSYLRLRVGYKHPILEYKLVKDCFTHEWNNWAYCYKEDLYFQKKINPESIKLAKQNLHKLNNLFAEKGLNVIILVCADKYDLYRPFMTDNTLPVDTLHDSLFAVPNIHIINTKPMLQAMVSSGEKDVYLINDTHWSYKASEAVAKKLARDIDSLGLKSVLLRKF
ncbi:MAG: hypothetical protein LBS50_09650 [Prevotellaceae bacterium]|jgi:hypothetical protein|nr:hypothetical protein [Prevotellaceae bacterium]